MIASKDLSTLIPASELLQHAKSSKLEYLESAVARQLNYAANTSDNGYVKIDWDQPLPKELINKLSSFGYTVEPKKDLYGSDVKNYYIITAKG